jgi:integrase
MRLSDLAVKALPIPVSGQKTYFDEILPGFGVRVSQGGARSFVVMYGQKRQLKTIGRYPEKSLKEARKEAHLILGSGEVPKTLEDAVSALSEHVEDYLTHVRRNNRPRTASDYERHLKLHLPKSPTRENLAAKFLELADRPGEYRHAFLSLRTYFNWCVHVGHISQSPMQGMQLTVTPQPRTRVLTGPELKAIWNYEDRPFTDVVKLMILTGQRRSEITAVQPLWIDKDQVHLPTTITKNKHPHSFPIGPLAQEIFTRAPFSYQGWSKGKARMDKAVGVGGYTLHDLRRTFVSHHAAIGTPLHITEKLVNHISGSFGGIVSVYNQHKYVTEMREAALLFEKYVTKLVTA